MGAARGRVSVTHDLFPDRHYLPRRLPLTLLLHAADEVGEEIGIGGPPFGSLCVRKGMKGDAALGKISPRRFLGGNCRLEIALGGVLGNGQEHGLLLARQLLPTRLADPEPPTRTQPERD